MATCSVVVHDIECLNEFGNFLENGYTISNVNELTEEEILQEIERQHNESTEASN